MRRCRFRAAAAHPQTTYGISRHSAKTRRREAQAQPANTSLKRNGKFSFFSALFFVALALAGCCASWAQITPVIGGKCNLSAPDVHIGGKQTQFFLKCEPSTSNSSNSDEGIWVVKSRQQGVAPNRIPASVIAEKAENSGNGDAVSVSGGDSSTRPTVMHSHLKKASPSKYRGFASEERVNAANNAEIEATAAQRLGCVDDGSARVGSPCALNDNCLHAVYGNHAEYLQCDPVEHRWTKRHCQPGYAFSFAQQTCALPTAKGTSFRQFARSGGLVCNYAQCSPATPCALGTCNGGYCCSPAAAAPSFLAPPPPPLPPPGIYSAPGLCPGGLQPYGVCNAGYCAPNHECVQPANVCCQFPPAGGPPPQLAPPPPPLPLQAPAYCPGGALPGGSCVAGRCAPGYACSPPNNVCCAQMAQAIPATVCPDGTQAAGACVNNQCGAGFICNQGLCCATTSQTPRCLDGSQAIGACIQGNCGTGYSCTTGNICCPSTLNTCPNGQVSLGSCVNGQCPVGYTCINNQCCGASNSSAISCPREDSRGPCDTDGTCPEPGTECDTLNNWCCPRVMGDPMGSCIQGEGGNRLCPDGYACTGPGAGQCYRLETNTCPAEEQFGPCAPTEPQCPPGYTCIGDFCCSDDGSTANTFRHRHRRAKRRTPAFMQWM